MGGIRNPSPHDSSYFILILLTALSAILTPILLIAYIAAIYDIYTARKNTKKLKNNLTSQDE